MNVIEKRKKELADRAKREELQAYAKAWRAVSITMGDELSDLVLDRVLATELKTDKQRGEAVRELLEREGFRWKGKLPASDAAGQAAVESVKVTEGNQQERAAAPQEKPQRSGADQGSAGGNLPQNPTQQQRRQSPPGGGQPQAVNANTTVNAAGQVLMAM